MTESTIQRQIVDFLRLTGWYVRVNSQDRRVRGQLAGLPDVIALRWGTTLFIETKTRRGKTREAQTAFAESIREHLGDHLRYVKARSLEDVLEAITDAEKGP